jgi:hypothetical protein
MVAFAIVFCKIISLINVSVIVFSTVSIVVHDVIQITGQTLHLVRTDTLVLIQSTQQSARNSTHVMFRHHPCNACKNGAIVANASEK